MHTTRAWILVVEDEPLLARILCRRIAQTIEADTGVCADSTSALALIEQRGSPLAIVLDGSLGPRNHGADVLAAIRDAGERARCAFWTSAPEDTREALRARGVTADLPVFVKQDVDAVVAWLRDAVP